MQKIYLDFSRSTGTCRTHREKELHENNACLKPESTKKCKIY